MQNTILLIRITIQWAAVSVIAVGRDLDTGWLSTAIRGNDHRRVLKYIPFKDQLDHISRFCHCQILRYCAYRSWGDFGTDQKIVQIFDTCPCRSLVIRVDIVPSKDRCVVHNACARVDALRRKVRTIAAYPLIIIEFGIAAICPVSCICYRFITSIRLQFHVLSPLSPHCMNPAFLLCVLFTIPDRLRLFS